MSAVSRLSLHRLESLQQLFVKLQHNQRIVSEQPEARRSDVFTAALSHLTGKGKSHGRCFASDLEIAGAWWQWRFGAGAGAAPALTRGRRMPKNRCLLGGQGCQRTPAPFLQCHRLQAGENARGSGRRFPLPGGPGRWLKPSFAQDSLVWEDHPVCLLLIHVVGNVHKSLSLVQARRFLLQTTGTLLGETWSGSVFCYGH